jgi:hypothetical protein
MSTSCKRDLNEASARVNSRALCSARARVAWQALMVVVHELMVEPCWLDGMSWERNLNACKARVNSVASLKGDARVIGEAPMFSLHELTRMRLNALRAARVMPTAFWWAHRTNCPFRLCG